MQVRNPGQMSPEVQNKGISGPTKKTRVLEKKNELCFVRGRASRFHLNDPAILHVLMSYRPI